MMKLWSVRVLTNAILRPSGDHFGPLCTPHWMMNGFSPRSNAAFACAYVPGAGDRAHRQARAERPGRGIGTERAIQSGEPSGRVIAAGSTQRSKSAAETSPSASAASRRLVPSRCAFCAILAAFS